jgi:glucodextranase-like protein
MRRCAAGVISGAALIAALASPDAGHAATSAVAPGAPGAAATWAPADKHGFGTSAGTASKVWYTLEHGELTEVYYPDLGTPSLRDLQLIVTDGSTFADLERDATTSKVTMPDPHSPDLPADRHRQERALPHHQDVRDRSGAVSRADRHFLPVADRQALSGLRIR